MTEELSWEDKLDIYRQFREDSLTRSEAIELVGDDAWAEVSQAGSIRFSQTSLSDAERAVIENEGLWSGNKIVAPPWVPSWMFVHNWVKATREVFGGRRD